MKITSVVTAVILFILMLIILMFITSANATTTVTTKVTIVNNPPVINCVGFKVKNDVEKNHDFDLKDCDDIKNDVDNKNDAGDKNDDKGIKLKIKVKVSDLNGADDISYVKVFLINQTNLGSNFSTTAWLNETLLGKNKTLNDTTRLYEGKIRYPEYPPGNYYIEVLAFDRFGAFGNWLNYTNPQVAFTIESDPENGDEKISGGGGSGGSVVTSEPLDNIAKAEMRVKNLIANNSVIYSLTTPELEIYLVVVTGKENEYDVAIRVESLKGTSRLVKIPALGTVYANTNVWLGTKRIKEVLIKFKVKNSWIDEKQVARSDIQLLRYIDNEWKSLETKVINTDDMYTYYEAKTLGLSNFAISAVKEGQLPPKEEVPTATENAILTETGKEAVPIEKVPGFEVATAILTLFSAVYLFSAWYQELYRLLRWR
jgi:PGF-pre-PGF domain-containing protein